MYIDEEGYFEHHGVKGQKWGIRNDLKRIGRGLETAAKGIGRGVKKTAKFAKKHPRAATSVVAGAAFAATVLTKRHMSITKASAVQSEHLRRLSHSGSAWRVANGPWNYAVPHTTPMMNESTKALLRAAAAK